jgi:hypothetical protein
MTDTNLTNANLENVSGLSGATIEGSDFTGANLRFTTKFAQYLNSTCPDGSASSDHSNYCQDVPVPARWST